eukprot:scaffold37_cov346-Pavlova_lutheri.AAC.21
MFVNRRDHSRVEGNERRWKETNLPRPLGYFGSMGDGMGLYLETRLSTPRGTSLGTYLAIFTLLAWPKGQSHMVHDLRGKAYHARQAPVARASPHPSSASGSKDLRSSNFSPPDARFEKKNEVRLLPPSFVALALGVVPVVNKHRPPLFEPGCIVGRNPSELGFQPSTRTTRMIGDPPKHEHPASRNGSSDERRTTGAPILTL